MSGGFIYFYLASPEADPTGSICRREETQRRAREKKTPCPQARSGKSQQHRKGEEGEVAAWKSGDAGRRLLVAAALRTGSDGAGERSGHMGLCP